MLFTSDFMEKLSEEEKGFLLELASETIKRHIRGEKMELKHIPKGLEQRAGTFVSLHKNGELRGCIGSIQPVNPIYLDVIKNSIAAAFKDPRFPPLKDLDGVEIEISVLSRPEKLDYKNKEGLLKKLEPKKHGVIIKKGFHQATFLPQVWDSIPDKEAFLTHLCMKAGLDGDEWERQLEVYVYEVDCFSSKQTS
jgi:AmmeMemoRadiSam system protein A